MPLYDFSCPVCGKDFEEIAPSGESALHCGAPALRRVSAPKTYIIRGGNSSSTSPKRFNNAEPRRREAKRERVTRMLDRLDPNKETNKTKFTPPAGPRKGIKLW